MPEGFKPCRKGEADGEKVRFCLKERFHILPHHMGPWIDKGGPTDEQIAAMVMRATQDAERRQHGH